MSDGSCDVRTAWITAFVTAGVVTTAQEIATVVLRDIEGIDSSTLAEETICLVVLTSARAVEAAAHPSTADAASAIRDLPFLYRDYIIGGAIIEDPDRAVDEDQAVYERLARTRSFYEAHFPSGAFPGPRAVEDKLALWMGRISPPRLQELPTDRLKRLELAPRLITHLRLTLEFARQSSGSDGVTIE